jgi:uncharacterized protein (UPF0332 family)
MKAEVAALLDKAASSRRAAALLATQDYVDFAASRAYYALFYKERRCSWRKGLPFPAMLR